MATSILPGTTRSGGHARTYKLGAGLRMRGATSGRVGILPPATITDYDLTLPGSLAASDKLLQVSSAGVVSLVDPVTIGGAGTELLYRGGASSAAAVAGSSWNGTTLTLPTVTCSGAGESSTRFGAGTAAAGNRATAIGADASASATYSVAVGQSSLCSGVSGLAMGRGANATAESAIAIGAATKSQHESSIVIGRNGQSTASNQLIFHNVSTAYFGNGVTASSPLTATLYGTGGSGTNVVGGDLCIAPGPSTGSATRSYVHVMGSYQGSSGSTPQPQFSVARFSHNQLLLDTNFPNSAAPFYLDFYNTAGSVTRARITADNGNGYINCFLAFSVANASKVITEYVRIRRDGKTGFLTTAPDRQVEINSTTGDCLRLTYNDSNGSAAYYADFAVSSAGNLTVTPSGGLASLVGDFAVASTNYHYWGASDVDGSWRIGRSGNDIVIERREAGAWVTKSTIAA